MKPEFAGQDKRKLLPTRSTVKSGTLIPAVTMVAVLSAALGSNWLAEAVAALASAPRVVGRNAIVNEALPPLGSEPIVHVKVPCTFVQAPTEAFAETSASPAGIWSSNATLTAGAGPRLVTVSVEE